MDSRLLPSIEYVKLTELKHFLAKFIFFLIVMASAHSFASDFRLSYVLGVPNFLATPERSESLYKRKGTLSNKFELTYLSSANSGYLASIGAGRESSSYSLAKTNLTPYQRFEADYNFYYAQIGYRLKLPSSDAKQYVEAVLGLGTGDMDFDRKGGSKINLKNVQYQAIDIRYVAPMLAIGKGFDFILGLGVSKGTVKDFSLDSTRYSGSDFESNFFWQLGIGYHFGGE